MTRIGSALVLILALVLTFFGGGAISAQDKYMLQVAGGLAFSEFRGYEDWQVIAISENLADIPDKADKDFNSGVHLAVR